MKNVNILLADDESAVGPSVSLALRGFGCSVDVVPDGQDALLRIFTQPGHYQVLITDDKMKRCSGLELVRQLRDSRFSGKIVVLSAYLTPELLESYRGLGVTGFVAKPFNISELRMVVQKAAHDLSQHR